MSDEEAGEHQRKDNNGTRRELRVHLPWGISFSLRGFDVILVIIAAVMPLTAYFMWEIKVEGRKEHRLIVEAIEVQTYILTLTQEQREALNLAMPESVKRRTVEERRRMRELNRSNGLEGYYGYRP